MFRGLYTVLGQEGALLQGKATHVTHNCMETGGLILASKKEAATCDARVAHCSPPEVTLAD